MVFMVSAPLVITGLSLTGAVTDLGGVPRLTGDPGAVEADALADLSRCALADGHTASAQDNLWQAQEIFRSIGAAEASTIAAELSARPDPLQTKYGASIAPPVHPSQDQRTTD